jgi:hypothetical protein
MAQCDPLRSSEQGEAGVTQAATPDDDPVKAAARRKNTRQLGV